MTDRQRTHGHDCWGWGPAHYDCAVREIERLRKMHQDAYQRGLQAGSRGLREMYDTIQAVKRQDAWGNTRLTDALMAAEERAERAEAEIGALRAEVDRLNRILGRIVAGDGDSNLTIRAGTDAFAAAREYLRPNAPHKLRCRRRLE